MTLADVLVSIAITIPVMGAVVTFADSARRTYQRLPEAADLEQRLRAGADSLTRDLVMAGSGRKHGSSDPCANDVSVWPAGSDEITVLYVPRGQTAAVSRTYYVTRTGTGTTELSREDETLVRLPVADHITELRFAYFGGDGTLLDQAMFDDGPWCGEGTTQAFDMDLARIRRIRVTLRAESSIDSVRIPDRELEFDVAPRNLGLE